MKSDSNDLKKANNNESNKISMYTSSSINETYKSKKNKELSTYSVRGEIIDTDF